MEGEKMKVRHISETTPSPELQAKGINTAEDLIVYAARVSNPSNQLNTATGDKLLKYCMVHGHWSVFEQASMGVEIVTSRAISAQILRHRSFHFQEFSQRYASVQQFEPVQLRRQADKNRQSSAQLMPDAVLNMKVKGFMQHAEAMYEELLDAGVARECARMILPMYSQTVVYMTGTIRDWIHYLNLRLKADTQLEHREVAMAIGDVFCDRFPVIAKALIDCFNTGTGNLEQSI
jgi:thymidylate synthase (FAD)